MIAERWVRLPVREGGTLDTLIWLGAGLAFSFTGEGALTTRAVVDLSERAPALHLLRNIDKARIVTREAQCCGSRALQARMTTG